MSHIKKWWTVLVSICGGWWSAMSGAVSIPLAFAALVLGGSANRWFEASAFAGLWVCLIRMGIANYAILQGLKTKITTSCENAPAVGGTSLRLKIESLSDSPIRNCQARIIQIKKDGEGAFEASVHSAPLMFAPNELRIVEKTIPPKSHEIVDVILVGEHYFLPGTKDHQWVADRRFTEYFAVEGVYYLTVEIMGEMPTQQIFLKFTWNGHWKTASLERVRSFIEIREARRQGGSLRLLLK